MFLIYACLQDENRYSVSRGAHKNLRRAEKARVIVNKIPGNIGNVSSRENLCSIAHKTVYKINVNNHMKQENIKDYNWKIKPI